MGLLYGSIAAKSRACCKVSACAVNSSVISARGLGPKKYWSSSCHNAPPRWIVQVPTKRHGLVAAAEIVLTVVGVQTAEGVIVLELGCCGSGWNNGTVPVIGV